MKEANQSNEESIDKEYINEENINNKNIIDISVAKIIEIFASSIQSLIQDTISSRIKGNNKKIFTTNEDLTNDSENSSTDDEQQETMQENNIESIDSDFSCLINTIFSDKIDNLCKQEFHKQSLDTLIEVIKTSNLEVNELLKDFIVDNIFKFQEQSIITKKILLAYELFKGQLCFTDNFFDYSSNDLSDFQEYQEGIIILKIYLDILNFISTKLLDKNFNFNKNLQNILSQGEIEDYQLHFLLLGWRYYVEKYNLEINKDIIEYFYKLSIINSDYNSLLWVFKHNIDNLNLDLLVDGSVNNINNFSLSFPFELMDVKLPESSGFRTLGLFIFNKIISKDYGIFDSYNLPMLDNYFSLLVKSDFMVNFYQEVKLSDFLDFINNLRKAYIINIKSPSLKNKKVKEINVKETIKSILELIRYCARKNAFDSYNYMKELRYYHAVILDVQELLDDDSVFEYLLLSNINVCCYEQNIKFNLLYNKYFLQSVFSQKNDLNDDYCLSITLQDNSVIEKKGSEILSFFIDEVMKPLRKFDSIHLLTKASSSVIDEVINDYNCISYLGFSNSPSVINQNTFDKLMDIIKKSYRLLTRILYDNSGCYSEDDKLKNLSRIKFEWKMPNDINYAKNYNNDLIGAKFKYDEKELSSTKRENSKISESNKKPRKKIKVQ